MRKGRLPRKLTRKHERGRGFYAIWTSPDPEDNRKTRFIVHADASRNPATDRVIVNTLPAGAKLFVKGPVATAPYGRLLRRLERGRICKWDMTDPEITKALAREDISLNTDYKDPLEPMNRALREWRKRRLNYRRKLKSLGKLPTYPEQYTCSTCGRLTLDPPNVPGYPEKKCRSGCEPVPKT